MTFQQPKLPYDIKALAPFLSEEQMHYHYHKHHAAYFKKLNALAEGTSQAKLPLEEVIQKSSGALFNNAAQAWNHTFFWHSISPSGGGHPKGRVLEALESTFGGFEEFKKKFSEAAKALFGSGWTWLAKDDQGSLEILALSNAETPIKYGKKPLLTLDVWEHAYYIDYRNDRPRYVEGFWEVVHWNFVEKCYEE